MKYLVILSLVVFCAYFQFTSVQAASTSRQKRWLARGSCPENTTTAEECLSHVRETGGANGCVSLSSDGVGYTITGCGTVQCVVDGKEVKPKSDLSKPHPHCCPKC